MKKLIAGLMTITIFISGTSLAAQPVAAEATQSVPNFVNFGEKFYGTPYDLGAVRYFNWDGSVNPAFTGKSFDCSSFTQYVAWMALGVKLNGTSYDQAQKDGYVIPKSSLRAGDLVFFTTASKASLPVGDPNRVGHVALFAGYGDVVNGRFVPGGSKRPVMLEASTSAGVKCVYMDTDYWNNYYITSKRIVESSDATNPKISIEGIGQLNTSQPPMIINGRTVVPFRDIFEAFNTKVDWDQDSQTVTATRGDGLSIKLTIDNPQTTIGNSINHDSRTFTLDQPAKVINGHTMVPLRFVANALTYDVDWDAKTQTVYIQKPNTNG